MTRQRLARRVLQDVGDADAGEWFEKGGIADHLRRRLTAEEAAMVGPVVDVRGTDEAQRRFLLVQPYLPAGWTDIQ